MTLIERLRERFRRRQDAARYALSLKSAGEQTKGRSAVEHGPTKAPFSRDARRRRNRAAEPCWTAP